MSARNIPTLDGWRAIAISLVMFAHAIPSLTHSGGNSETTLIGITGVRIFFGLSGFLITSLLLLEEKNFGSIDLKSFYVRRFFRILPAAMAFLAVVGLLSMAGILDVTLRRWIDVIFFYANYSSAPPAFSVAHFWSLAVEEHFYFVWPPLLIALASFRNRLLVAIFVCLIVAAWRFISFKFHLGMEDTARFWGRTDVTVDAIMWGAIVAIMATNANFARLLLSDAARMAVPIIYACALAGVFLYSGWKGWLLFNEATFVAGPALIFQTSQLGRESITRYLLDLPAIRWVGRISYSLYLWQQLFLTPEQSSFMQTFPLNIICVFSCASISYYLIESPMITSRRQPRPVLT